MVKPSFSKIPRDPEHLAPRGAIHGSVPAGNGPEAPTATAGNLGIPSCEMSIRSLQGAVEVVREDEQILTLFYWVG